MRVTFQSDVVRLEYTLDDSSTWMQILEDAVFPGLRGCGYMIPDNDDLMNAIGDAFDEDEP